MKIYLAAPWVDRELMPELAAKLEAAGHTLTWKWWETEDTSEGERTVEALAYQALKDFRGVVECQTLVLWNSKKSEGKAVEQGVALAKNKEIIAIGKRGDGTSSNVFHYLPNYTWVGSIEEAIECLNM